MGFMSRLFIPRGVPRALHPARTVRRAVTPRSVKQLRRAAHPIDNAAYGVTRSLNTRRRRGAGPSYHHGNCPVSHRTQQTAARCKNR
jgi:hypothetical protein